MCLLALDVDSLALDLSVFFLALGPMLISGVGGTQGKKTLQFGLMQDMSKLEPLICLRSGSRLFAKTMLLLGPWVST